MLPNYSVILDKNNLVEEIVIDKDLFVNGKNYYMVVVGIMFGRPLYKFKIKKIPKFFDNRLWENFDLEGLTIYQNFKTDNAVEWDGKIKKREVIPEGEKFNHFDSQIEGILSQKWPIWCNVEGIWITPEFKDVPSFLYREWVKGDLTQNIEISFEEIINPMAINWEVL
jgi:hypothetical protein